MILYFFPPVGGGGVQRNLAYARYLPSYGWRPVVVATRNPGYRVRDASLGRSLPSGVGLERTRGPEPVHARNAIGRLIRSSWSRQRPQAGARAAGGSQTGSPGIDTGQRPWWWRSGNAAWAYATRLLFFPDEQILWIPFATIRGVRIHHREPLDVVYSSSAPVTSHLIAGLVSRITHVPWVADFRDPWVGNTFAASSFGFQRWLQVRIERWIVRRADRVVFATPSMHRAYARRYPRWAGRFATIPNGYDPADFPETSAGPRDPDHFRLVYAGAIHTATELDRFLGGVELLLARRPDLGQRLRIEFVGWLSGANEEVAASWAARLSPVVTFSGFRPRADVIGLLQQANAGLQLLDDGPGRQFFVGGKLFDYLALNLPIFVMAPPGDTRALVTGLGWGTVVDPNPEAVAGGLEAFVEAPASSQPADPEGRYDRQRLTGQLAEILDDLVA
jgi:glycosyltransferase involved in cell wall biosynthesis